MLRVTAPEQPFYHGRGAAQNRGPAVWDAPRDPLPAIQRSVCVPENEKAAAPVSPYTQLASVGPYDVRIGSALITMVEPHVGHEVAYNRWYEDDHFYAGAMAMPWMFAGRRYVATTDLQALRQPRTGSAVADPIELGKYIAIYWINTGRYAEHLRWSLGINNRLLADGRVYLKPRPHLHRVPGAHHLRLPRPGRAARHPRVRPPARWPGGGGRRRLRGLHDRRRHRLRPPGAGAQGPCRRPRSWACCSPRSRCPKTG